MKKYNGFIISLIILIGLISFSPVKALENERPLREILSYEEFTSLIKYNAGRVPEFRSLWTWMAQNGHTDVYWTGGTVRGFLRWHYSQLQKHSLEEIRKLPPPHLADIQVLGGNDLDIVGTEKSKEKVLEILSSIPEVDYIDKNNVFKELVDIGGPTIEKTIINPFKIEDSSSGLKSYYEGKLVFKAPPKEVFRRIPIIENEDYTKTVEALRFIRFLYNVPEVKAVPESIEEIRKIADEEREFVREEHRRDWIVLTLHKLVKSTKGDVPRVIRDLQKYNLLTLLADAGVWVPSDKSLKSYIRDGQLTVEEFSAEELSSVSKMIRSNILINIRNWVVGLISKVKSSKGASGLRLKEELAPVPTGTTAGHWRCEQVWVK